VGFIAGKKVTGGHYKKSFFAAGNNRIFYQRTKWLISLVRAALFSQRFIREENRVNPTVGFRIRFWVW
jgi:hypothetical protein